MSVPLYYIENEKEVFAYLRVLESLLGPPRAFGDHLQNLYLQLTGEKIPELKAFYDSETLEEHYRIRVSQVQYAYFLNAYWSIERYLPYLEKLVDPTAIVLYREIGEILSGGDFSGIEDEAA